MKRTTLAEKEDKKQVVSISIRETVIKNIEFNYTSEREREREREKERARQTQTERQRETESALKHMADRDKQRVMSDKDIYMKKEFMRTLLARQKTAFIAEGTDCKTKE